MCLIEASLVVLLLMQLDFILKKICIVQFKEPILE